MNSFKVCLLALCASVCSITAFSQGEVPVDMFTGTPGISIPLWTVQDHDLSVPIGLSYNGSGLKLEESTRFVGIGWDIIGGGSITREVRGLPDDFNGIDEAFINNVNYDDRRGWLYNRVGASTVLAKEISDFSPTSDASASTCSDEAVDYGKYLSLFKYSDTEPDVFHINAPGLSGSFVFDNAPTPQIRFLSVQDVQIAYARSITTNDIFSFTVTTPEQIKYNFSAISVEEESNQLLSTTIFSYKLNEYSLFNHKLQQTSTSSISGNVKYHRQWMLSSIESSSGAKITFSYTSKLYDRTEPVKIGIRKINNSGFDPITLYNKVTKTYYQVLNSVQSSTGEKVEFVYPENYLLENNNGVIKSIQVTDSRRKNELVKEYVFNHIDVGSSYVRPYLESLNERAYCDELPPYKFSYIGVNLINKTSSLPPPNSTSKDFWGFYNGKSNSDLFPTLYVYPALPYPEKVRLEPLGDYYTGTEIILPGADRRPDGTFMKIGTLDFIQYPTGGKMAIQYEPHTYLDPLNNDTFVGGGLRVKSLRYNDGMNPSGDIYKEFIYEQGTGGVSSGRIWNMPVFYIPSYNYQNGGTTISYETLVSTGEFDVWNRLLARTEDDIASQEYVNGSPVAYTSVTVKRPGSGAVKFVYNLPASYKTSTSGEWVATTNKFARSTACQNMGILKSTGGWQFPFTRNPNFHHERGLLLNKYEYSEGGQLVRETTNTYQTLYKSGSTPTKVWGIMLENFPNAGAYVAGKYFLLTEVSKVLSSQTIKEIRSGTAGLTSTQEYFYESANHKYLTRTKSTNSDGAIYTTKIKYPKDYATVTGTADVPTQMIAYMQSQGMNSVPIEVIKMVQLPGQVEKVIAANITIFNPFNAGKPLVHQTYTLTASQPISDFIESTIQTRSTATFNFDKRHYELTGQVNHYDNTYRQPVTVENPINRTISTSALGYGKSVPVVTVKEATLPQIGFSDFESTTDVQFTQSAELFGEGRTGDKGILASVKLSRTILNASSNYLLSFWAKTSLSSLTVNYIFKNTAQAQLSNGSFTIPSTGGKFKYFEKTINVSSLPATFIVEIVGTSASTDYGSVLDDIAFYPTHSELSTFTYDFPYGISSATDATAKTTFSSFDHLGRQTYAYDQDKNIKAKNTYSFTGVQDKITAEFAVKPQGPPIVQSTFKFVALEGCHENVTYQWNIGAGFFNGSRTLTQTFNTPGFYTISLRVSAPGHSTATVTKQITVKSSFTICAKGLKLYDPIYGNTTNFTPCSSINTTPLSKQTIFLVLNPGNTTYTTFTWRYRSIGETSWNLHPDNALEFKMTLPPTATTGYEVMCEATNATGSAQSNIITVNLISDII